MKETQAGLYLIKQGNGVLKAVGQGLLAFAPLHMKTLPDDPRAKLLSSKRLLTPYLGENVAPWRP